MHATISDDVLYVGVYWKARKETPGQIAARLSSLLDDLRGFFPKVVTWRVANGRRSKTVDARTRPDQAKLEVIIANGTNRTDTDKRAIPELGFHIVLTCSSDFDIALSCNAGVYSRYNSNFCVIQMPTNVNRNSPPHATLVSVLKCLVANMNPDFGRISSYQIDDLSPDRPRQIRAGWVTFISNEFNLPKKASQIASIIEKTEQGHLVFSTVDRPRMKREDDVMQIKAMAKVIHSI